MSHDRLHRCASNILALTPYLHSPTSSEGGCEPFSHPNREPARATWLRPPRKNRSHHARAEVLPSPQRANIAPNQIPGQRNGKGSQRATAMRCIGTAMRAMHEKNLRLCDCWLLFFAARCTFKNGVVCAVSEWALQRPSCMGAYDESVPARCGAQLTIAIPG